jgi:uncharacterized membrane-anchored protein YitT (DUF2179 family)
MDIIEAAGQAVKRGAQFLAAANSERLLTWKWWRSYLLILCGSIIMASGYVYFIVPYKIVPGGVYGIGIILYYLFHFPTGLSGLLMNIPLILLGMRVLGPRFGAKTLIGMVLTSTAIDVLTRFWGDKPLVPGEPLLSAVFGGVLIGAGLGLIFKARATTGGSDIIAQVIAKWTNGPIGQILVYVDSFIVIFGVIAFRNIELALYAIITIYVTGKVLDSLLTGMGYLKSVMIISDRPDEIRTVILHKLDRGGTFLNGQGMYKHEEKRIVLTALSRRELAILEDQVKLIDPKAFMIITDAFEIKGHGFKPLEGM